MLDRPHRIGTTPGRRMFLAVAATFLSLMVLMSWAPNGAEAAYKLGPVFDSDGPVRSLLTDVNDDAKPDLIEAVFGAKAFTVRLGQGGGQFGPASKFPGAAAPYAPVRAGDFNGDGKVDIFAPSGTDGYNVQVILGKGDGSFGPPVESQSFALSANMAVGRIDGDKRTDVAIEDTSENRVVVLKGMADGSLGDPVFLETGRNPLDIVLADLDGDKDLDIATANPDLYFQQIPSITIILNKGDGNFGASTTTKTLGIKNKLAYYAGLLPGDFNSDGKIDLFLEGYEYPNAFAPGDNSGKFSSIQPLKEEWINESTVLDFDGDGDLDVAFNGNSASALYVKRGDGKGGFALTEAIPMPRPTDSFSTAELNGDGLPDFAAGLSYEKDDLPMGTAIFLSNADVEELAPPTLSGTSPASPGLDPVPRVLGHSKSGTSVRVFGDENCGGSPLAQIGVVEFNAGELAVPVASNAKTTFSARAVGADNVLSACSNSIEYVHTTCAASPNLGACKPTLSIAQFDGVRLHILLKCPDRFKPGCRSTSIPMTKEGWKVVRSGGKSKRRLKGKPMARPVKSKLASGSWKRVSFKIKPKFRAKVAAMAKIKKKKLVVMQAIRSKRIGKKKNKGTAVVFHRYRVRGQM